jgi:hypothetical protein
MNLSKNDKIIAVIGVIILIIAGISIAVIVSNEDTEDEEEEPTEETFYVTWTNSTDMMTEDGIATKTYNEPLTITVPSGRVLTNVDIKLSWSDDNTIGGKIIKILKRGEDTLIAEITPEEGESERKSSKGGGTLDFSFYINDIPSDEEIDAEDIYEAEDMVYSMYEGQETTTFDISVTVNVGEPLIKPIRRFMDKGDNFELEITYDYYCPEFESNEDDYDDNGNDDDDMDEESFLNSFYQNLNYGKNWI